MEESFVCIKASTLLIFKLVIRLICIQFDHKTVYN